MENSKHTAMIISEIEVIALKEIQTFLNEQDGHSHNGYYHSYRGWAGRQLAAVISRAAPTVKIEVRGGIAEVTQCPPGVEVEIVDHDNEKVGR